VGITDYVLAGLQGIANSLAVYRTQFADQHIGVGEILSNSVLFGPIVGIAGMFLFAVIWGRLGKRIGGKASRNQIFHVLAYGGIPVAAALILWILTPLVAGEGAFLYKPEGEVDGFMTLVLRLQFAAYVFLLLWSVVLQVMGFSEIQGLTTRKAFGAWVLGQLLWALASILLLLLFTQLFPDMAPAQAN
jgi:hypothetical protein